MLPSECIEWWRDGVIEGEFVGEAFRNYQHFQVTEEYQDKVVEDDPSKTRAAINEKRKKKFS